MDDWLNVHSNDNDDDADVDNDFRLLRAINNALQQVFLYFLIEFLYLKSKLCIFTTIDVVYGDDATDDAGDNV